MRITISRSAAESFEALPTLVKVRLLRIFERLESWPAVSGAKPLRGSLAGHYRMRTGAYRVQFRIEATHLVIERVGHRDGFYDQ